MLCNLSLKISQVPGIQQHCHSSGVSWATMLVSKPSPPPRWVPLPHYPQGILNLNICINHKIGNSSHNPANKGHIWKVSMLFMSCHCFKKYEKCLFSIGFGPFFGVVRSFFRCPTSVVFTFSVLFNVQVFLVLLKFLIIVPITGGGDFFPPLNSSI